MIRDPALILVDLQKDFCQVSPSSETDQEVYDATLNRAGAFLERYRESGRTPIFVRTTHDEHSNSPAWSAKFYRRDKPMPCRPGTEGAELADALSVKSSDIVVTKHRYSGFYGTDLETYLSSNDVTRLLVGGTNTNVCVASTVFGAFDRDFYVTILEDCTITDEPEFHEQTLRNIESNFGTVSRSGKIEL